MLNSLRYRLISTAEGGFLLETQPLSSKANLSSSSGPLSRILLCAAQRGWRDECTEEGSCSFSRSRASTLRFLFPPSSFCWGMLRRSALSLSLTPLHRFAFSPSFLNLVITHSCRLSLSLLLSCLTLFFFHPADSLPPSLSHSLVISLTLHALSTVKADCYQQRHTHTDSPTHTHNNWLLQTMFYSFSLHLFPPSSFSH